MLVRFAVAACLSIAACSAVVRADDVIKVGIIGCDTSHVPAFTNAFHKAKPGGPLAGFRVVAAYPAGSDDIEASYSRVAGFTKTLADQGVEIVDSVEALLPKVDAVLLESVDGRPHLAQAKPLFAANRTAATRWKSSAWRRKAARRSSRPPRSVTIPTSPRSTARRSASATSSAA